MTALENITKAVWPFALLLTGFVIVQATLFLVHALRFNKKHSLYTAEELKDMAKTSVIATVGPAFSVVIVVLTLIPLLGSAVTFMRCGVIGAADFELMVANIAANTVGIPFGDPNFDEAVFTVAIFGMITASATYFIHLILTCKPMDNAVIKAATKKRSFLPMLSLAAAFGFLGFWAVDTGSKSIPNAVGVIAGLLCSMGLGVVCQKHPKLKDWTMGLAMIGGMAAASIANAIVA